MQVVILNAGTGWHTDELCRALAERGHTGRVLPYEGLVARLGTGRGVARGLSVGTDGDPRCRRRARADHSERLARTDDLPRRRAALDREARRAGDELGRARSSARSTSSTRRRCCRRPGCRRPKRSSARARPTRWPRCWRWATSIIKPIFGSMGHGMVRVSDPDVAFRVVRALEQLRIVFYVQRAVDHGGRDVRVFVVGGRVLGAIERRAPDGRVAHERVARRRRRGRSTCRRHGNSSRCGRRRRSARTTRAWTCSRRATAGVRAGSERHPRLAGAEAGDRASTSPGPSWTPGGPRARGRGAREPVARSSRHDDAVERALPVAHDGDRRASPPQTWPAPRSSRACSRRARRSRGTCRRAGSSPTRATRTSSPARSRSASRLPAPARAARRNDPARRRGHGAMDALEHQSRHRPAAGAARARGAPERVDSSSAPENRETAPRPPFPGYASARPGARRDDRGRRPRRVRGDPPRRAGRAWAARRRRTSPASRR